MASNLIRAKTKCNASNECYRKSKRRRKSQQTTLYSIGNSNGWIKIKRKKNTKTFCCNDHFRCCLLCRMKRCQTIGSKLSVESIILVAHMCVCVCVGVFVSDREHLKYLLPNLNIYIQPGKNVVYDKVQMIYNKVKYVKKWIEFRSTNESRLKDLFARNSTFPSWKFKSV